MHILGLSSGSINGNSETLLKASITAAQAVDPTITASFIHVPSVSIPRNAPPINADASLASGLYDRDWGHLQNVPDDRSAVLDAVMNADALIFAAPVYSHQPAGILKATTDSILGPFADAAFARRVAKGKEQGDPKFADMPFDERMLKPKVAAFIVVCGSDHTIPDQYTMALPTMHLFTYPLHAKVIDQFIAPGCNYPGAAVLNDEAYIKRAQKLGRNVASQIGKEFDAAQYLGEEDEGACPYCHLLKFEFISGNHVRCITCGAEGKLEIQQGGRIRPRWEENSQVSSLTLVGKDKHLTDIFTGVALTKPQIMAEDMQKKYKYWKDVKIDLVPLPSNQ